MVIAGNLLTWLMPGLALILLVLVLVLLRIVTRAQQQLHQQLRQQRIPDRDSIQQDMSKGDVLCPECPA